MCELLDGWTHEMTRDHMLWSAYHQAAHGRGRRGGTWFRFPSKELVRRFGWEKNPHMPSMATAMPHVALEAAVAKRAMRRPMPRGAFARAHCPRRCTQNSDTTQDQRVAHPAPSRDSQASSPFLFDQATGLACKFNWNDFIDPSQHTAVIKGHVDNPGKRLRAGQYVTTTVNVPLK